MLGGSRFAATNLMGFVNGMACDQITGPLRHILAKGYEWQDKAEAHIVFGDIYKAFDYLSPAETWKTMQRRGAHPLLIAVFAREGEDLWMTPIFENLDLKDRIAWSRCERTGGTDTTVKINLVVQEALAECVPVWTEWQAGVHVNGRRYTRTLWADNIFIFGRSAALA